MILENWNIRHDYAVKKDKLTPVYGTIKDSMIARIGNLGFTELDNLVIEGVLCNEMTEEDCEFIE